MGKVHLVGLVMGKAKGLRYNMDDLAKALDVSSVVLGQVLRGERELAAEKFDIMEQLLDITIPAKAKEKGQGRGVV